jgi:hypothetical protein
MLKTQLNKILRVVYTPKRYDGLLRELIDAGKLQEAQELAEEAKSRYRKHLWLHMLHAKASFALKDEAAARESLQQISNGENGSYDLIMEAAELYQTMQEDELAVEILEEMGHRLLGWKSGAAFNRIGHIYNRNEKSREALGAFAQAVTRGGRVSWAAFNGLLPKCSREELLECKQVMEEDLAIEDRNAFFYKALSLIDSTLGHKESMLERIQIAAKKRFVSRYPDVPWVDSNKPLSPGFIIMGAMKCGTTSLFEQIELHPNCLITMDKELQFFQYKELHDDWYLNHFPRVSEFPGFVTGDGSPGYYCFDIVERVKSLCPDVKLLFIQRDPVKRAISHLRHNIRYGISNRGLEAVTRGIDDLERELLDNPENAEQILLDMCYGKRRNNSYLTMGCYEILLRRWRRAFPAEQIMVLHLEDYTENPQGSMNNVFEFIGLDPIDVQTKKSNSGSYIDSDPETQVVAERLQQFYDAVDSLKLVGQKS